MLKERSRTSEWIWKVADVLGMTARLERRDRRRLKANFRAIVSGSCRQLEVRGVDASRRGIGVLSAEAVEEGLLVFVRLMEMGLSGFAHVRRCQAQPQGGFVLGLEFRDELSRERTDAGAWQLQRLNHGPCGAWDATADA